MNEAAHCWLRLVPAVFGILALTGCSTQMHEDSNRSTREDSVVGIIWEWTETVTPADVIEVSRPDRYTIQLKQNGEARIRYDCNHGGSLYEISEGALSFGPLTATRIPCGEGSQGPIYMRQLTVVHAFFTENGFLYLELPADSGTMRFRKSGER